MAEQMSELEEVESALIKERKHYRSTIVSASSEATRYTEAIKKSEEALKILRPAFANMRGDALVISLKEFHDVKALIKDNEELVVKFKKNLLEAKAAEQSARGFLKDVEASLEGVQRRLSTYGQVIPLFPGASSDVSGS